MNRPGDLSSVRKKKKHNTKQISCMNICCILFVAYVFNLVIFKYTLHQAELMYFYFSAVRWLFSSLYFCCSVIALNDNQAHKIHLDFNIKKINCMKDKVLMKFYCIAASYFLYCRYIFLFYYFSRPLVL